MIEHGAAWLLAVGGGGIVGGLYFTSLWWTVRRLPRAAHPVLLVAGGFLLRGTLAAAALLAVSGASAPRLMGALAGFLVVRALFVRAARAVPPRVVAAGALQEKR